MIEVEKREFALFRPNKPDSEIALPQKNAKSGEEE